MQFLLNDIPVLSAKALYDTSTQLGLDTSLWLGKANSFVDQHGIDPSYGYFLIDNECRQTLLAVSDNPTEGETEDEFTVNGGSNKADLTIKFDFGIEERVYKNLYLESIINVTPSLSGDEATYLVKLVDARFVFNSHEASYKGIANLSGNEWYNRVTTFLTKENLKYEYELDDYPTYGHFIYDSLSVRDYHVDTPETVKIGERDGEDVLIDTPLSWEEIFTAIFEVYSDRSRNVEGSIFPYWEANTHTLKLTFDSEIFPAWVPQDISLKNRSARDVIYELLFWSGTSIKYLGEGKFHFFSTLEYEGNFTGHTFSFYPSDVEHRSIETASQVVPEGISMYVPVWEEERFDNEKEDYYTTYLNLHVPEGEEPLTRGKRIPRVTLPIIHIEERNKNLPVGTGDELPGAEYYGYMKLRFNELLRAYFSRFPNQSLEFSEVISFEPKPFMDRVSWYALGDTQGTKLDSKLPIDFEAMTPGEIIPRELKLSVIIAKTKEAVLGGDQTFPFEEPRVLVGQLFPTSTAYNTVKRSYQQGEEVILIGGMVEHWKYHSLLLEDYDQDQLYFTIDDIPYLRLKIHKQYLVQLGSDINQGWSVKLLFPEVVNGKLPPPDEDEDIEDYIYIKNNPRITLDDNDDFIYIAYDHLAGDDVYNRWTVADAQNDILFLKGLPGYVQNPEEPTTGERRLVLKSPYSSTQPIGWLEEAADGRTDEELEDFIIQIINENPGTGTGEGGNTTMMRGYVNKAGGVASTDDTFPFDTATTLVSDGSVQPPSGSCDNTFQTPFVDNEPILLLKKDNGMWTGIKIRRNLIKASPITNVRGDEETFGIQSITAITGTAPLVGSNPLARGDGFGYLAGEVLYFEQTDDNKWQVIDRPDMTGIFRTTTQITAGSYNNTSGELTVGNGNARRMVESTTTSGRYSIVSATTVIRNMTTSVVAASKIIQAKKIGRYWFVDVETC